jgi:hypothetical protein
MEVVVDTAHRIQLLDGTEKEVFLNVESTLRKLRKLENHKLISKKNKEVLSKLLNKLEKTHILEANEFMAIERILFQKSGKGKKAKTILTQKELRDTVLPLREMVKTRARPLAKEFKIYRSPVFIPPAKDGKPGSAVVKVLYTGDHNFSKQKSYRVIFTQVPEMPKRDKKAKGTRTQIIQRLRYVGNIYVNGSKTTAGNLKIANKTVKKDRVVVRVKNVGSKNVMFKTLKLKCNGKVVKSSFVKKTNAITNVLAKSEMDFHMALSKSDLKSCQKDLKVSIKE